MATYDGIFEALGLEDWCGSSASSAPMSMSDLVAQSSGGDGGEQQVSLWDTPFPSLDA